MPSLQLVFFTLRTNVAFYVLIAAWMFAVGALSGGSFRVSGFGSWGALALFLGVLSYLALGGIRRQQRWAWFAATLIALCNLWGGIRCLITFASAPDTGDFSRQVGAYAFILYFLLSGLIILFGLYGGRTAGPPATATAGDDKLQPEQ